MLEFVILKPVHLLWINLITGLPPRPRAGHGGSGAKPEYEASPPRDPKDGVFAGGVGFDVAYQGFFVTVLTMAAFFIGERIQNGAWAVNSTDGTTVAFLTLSTLEIFPQLQHAFPAAEPVYTLSIKISSSGTAVLSLVLTLVAVCSVPANGVQL